MSESVGQHYKDDAGAVYFGWQKSLGELGGKLDARKFEGFIAPGDTVVDFGCGTGALLARLSAGIKLGIEPNEHARNDAKTRGIESVESPAEIADAFADVVISNHALEHALNPYGELRELRRILKPGGRIVIYVPLDDFRNQPGPEQDPNHHVYTWTPLLLCNLMTEAGFTVERSEVVTLYDEAFTRINAMAVKPPVIRLMQPIDLERFKPRSPLAETPARAVAIGNYLTGERREILCAACERAGIELTLYGSHEGNQTDHPEDAINNADIVFGKARPPLASRWALAQRREGEPAGSTIARRCSVGRPPFASSQPRMAFA